MMNVVCTIVSASYLPQALVLANSTRDFNPTIGVVVLVTDIGREDLPEVESAEFLSIFDLDLDAVQVQEMQNYYDVVEFATSLKPSLIKKLLSVGYETVIFLDPDVLVISNLDPIISNVKKHGAVFTPHRFSPIQNSRTHYAEEAFLQYGSLNLGFCGFNASGILLLNWWEQCLRWDSTRIPNSPVFTDQKWGNLFSNYFEIFLDKDPGLNLAPWNLDERNLQIEKMTLYANQSAVRFIHFSQMSGDLANGINNGLWDSMNNNTSQFHTSLGIICEITKDYMNKLSLTRQATKQIRSIGKINTNTRWERLVLREKSRARFHGLNWNDKRINRWIFSIKIIDRTDSLFFLFVHLDKIINSKNKTRQLFRKLFQSS